MLRIKLILLRIQDRNHPALDGPSLRASIHFADSFSSSQNLEFPALKRWAKLGRPSGTGACVLIHSSSFSRIALVFRSSCDGDHEIDPEGPLWEDLIRGLLVVPGYGFLPSLLLDHLSIL